jgi:uncharacterized protein (TIGR03437 family)
MEISNKNRARPVLSLLLILAAAAFSQTPTVAPWPTRNPLQRHYALEYWLRCSARTSEPIPLKRRSWSAANPATSGRLHSSPTFNGTPAPIFHLIPPVAVRTTASPEGSPGQIDLEAPNSLPTSGTVNVQLTTSTTKYANYTLNMVPASPGLYRFTDPNNGSQYVITQFANSAWVVLPAAATADIGLPACTAGTSASVECGEPANIGDYLVIYLMMGQSDTANISIQPTRVPPPNQ